MGALTKRVGHRTRADEQFQAENEVSANHVSFNFASETIAVLVVNCGDEAVMIQKQTTLGQSELVATEKIQDISTLKSRKTPKLTDRKDTKYDFILVKESVDTGISPGAKAKLSELIKAFSDVFFRSECIIGQCNKAVQIIQVEPRF